MSAIIALFVFTIRQAFGDLKFWLVVAALFLPCLLVVVIRYFGPPQSVHDAWAAYHGLIQFMFVLGLIPLACMIYGSGLIGSEVDSKTITYLITRTLKRRTVLATRFAAVFTVLAAACCLALVGLHICVVSGQEWATSVFGPADGWYPASELKIYLAMVPVAVGGFLAIFTLLGILVRRPLAWSLAYFVLFELVVGNVPAAVSKYSLARQLRGWVVSMIPEVAQLNPHVLVADAAGLWNVALVSAASLILACVWIGRRELVTHKVARD
jgi:ABC-2 type transport system permease protein